MAAGPIRNLLQQQDKALYQVKKKIKEQGAKTVAKVKQKIPTPAEIKEKFKPEANATSCNANGLKKSQKTYNKIKNILNTLKKAVEGAEKALKSIKKICDKIMAVIQKILGILGKLAALIGILSTVISVAKTILMAIGSIFVPPPTGGTLIAPGTAIFLKDKLDAAKGLIETIKATVSTFPKLLERYTSKALKYIGYVAKALAALLAVKNILNFVIGLLETLYLSKLTNCGAFNASVDYTDEDGNINPNNNGIGSGGTGSGGTGTGSGGTSTLTLPNPTEFLDGIGYTQTNIESGVDPFDFSDDLADYYESQLKLLKLQGHQEIIDKVYNANFQMIGYRRYKV